MGCYPLFACRDWDAIATDLDDLVGSLVCVSLVTDPFGRCDGALLERSFPDLVAPFKDHYVVELSADGAPSPSSHHRRNVDRALGRLSIELCDSPLRYLEEWLVLYETLSRRHRIVGLRTFSRHAFELQLTVPGIVVFRATLDGEPAGMVLWYAHGAVAYYHLGAFSEVGYAAGASFGLFSKSLEHLAASGIEAVSLGAGAGTRAGGEADDGLSRFKRGWATTRASVYLCGRVLDPIAYRAAVAKSGWPDDYFPAYRRSESA